MDKLLISRLTPHPKNTYYFDDVVGDAWDKFLESIRTSGVIEPIVVTQDHTIVSGHQRVRACKELGIEWLDAHIKNFNSEDEVLKQLIETNLRQRGSGNPNPVKLGRCIRELERIYEIKHGNNKSQKGELSQEKIAEQLGITTRSLLNYKNLAESIPEVQELVETGIIKPTTALSLIKRLNKDEQKQLAEKLISDGVPVSGKQADEEVEKLKGELSKARAEVDKAKSEADQTKADCEKQLRTAQAMFDGRVYNLQREHDEQLNDYIKSFNQAADEFRTKGTEYENTIKRLEKELKEAKEVTTPDRKSEARILELEKSLEDARNKDASSLIQASKQFVSLASTLLQMQWVCDRVNDLPSNDQTELIQAMFNLKGMVEQ